MVEERAGEEEEDEEDPKVLRTGGVRDEKVSNLFPFEVTPELNGGLEKELGAL